MQSARHNLPAAGILAWTLCVLCLWLGARLVCPAGLCGVPDADARILHYLAALRQPWLDTLMAAATWLGSMFVLLPAALVLAWRHWQRSERATAAFLALALGGAWLLAHAGKLLADRPRPDLLPALVSMPADPSFPSAHALQVSAFALAWLLRPGLHPGAMAIGAAALAILVVGLSRLYLQVHFPSDVAVGLAMGATWVTGLRLLWGGAR